MNLSVEKVKSLYYKKGLSARKVGERFGVSAWTVIKFMKRHKLSRRTSAESNRLNFIKSPKSFKIRSSLTKKEENLKIAGLMLYWAEGVKVGKNAVDLANSDPVMIKLFLLFLKEIYQVDKSKLRVLLYCYSNQDVQQLINYWSKITKISKTQFIKPYIREDFRQSKSNKMPQGLVHIRYNDQRLFSQIKEDIKKAAKNFS